MSATGNECILCARTIDLPPGWRAEAGATPLDESTLLDTLAAITPHWLARTAVETDPAFKQWIPYVLLRDSRDHLAVYLRRGTEARLHGLWSIGISGHINPQDNTTASADRDLRHFWQQTLWNGLRRELREEFPAAAHGTTRLLGLIHENRTTVNRVYLGAVFLHSVSVIAAAPGRELTGLGWLPLVSLGCGDLPLERFELWSRLALQLLHQP